jgi:hypothetical protein
MAFKMKYSPIKGVFGDFFKNIGAKKTDMGKLREKQARSSKGVSKYQHRVEESKRKSRELRAKNKEAKRLGHKDYAAQQASDKADYEFFKKHRDAGTTPGTPINPPKPESESKGTQIIYSGKKGDKYKYRTFFNTDDDERYQFQYPEDHEKYKGPDHWETSKTEEGRRAIKRAYLSKQAADPDSISWVPIQKKSPYKKGIGKYAKKAKGSRGYKMKRK